jgi:hypothetical protein
LGTSKKDGVIDPPQAEKPPVVVKIAIVCALALHILLDVLEVPLTLQELPVE